MRYHGARKYAIPKQTKISLCQRSYVLFISTYDTSFKYLSVDQPWTNVKLFQDINYILKNLKLSC